MFFGESAINLDAKGRLTIPVKYREMLADVCKNQLVITYNPFEVSSLYIYPKQEWQKVHDSVKPLSNFDPVNRNLQQKLIGSAFFIEPDKGSRIQLPISMRSIASMDKKVILLGMGDKFELWDSESLMESRSQVLDMSQGVSDDVRNLVI